MNSDIRWQQRFRNYSKALAQLEKFTKKESLSELEKQGVIKAFEYTYELGWKTLQDFLHEKGYEDIVGPKPVIEQAFQDGYIDGHVWVRMHKSCNLTSHTYNAETADEIAEAIQNEYVHALRALAERLDKETGQQLFLF